MGKTAAAGFSVTTPGRTAGFDGAGACGALAARALQNPDDPPLLSKPPSKKPRNPPFGNLLPTVAKTTVLKTEDLQHGHQELREADI